MIINKSKLAFMAALALASIVSPAFAQTDGTAHQRHLYDYAPGAGPGPASHLPSHSVDNPSTAGGGSMGYNECAGHPRC
jgi:hypothetical protein